MTQIATLAANARGLGTGGAKVKTGPGDPGSIRDTMLDVARDFYDVNDEGGLAVTLRVTEQALGMPAVQPTPPRDTDYGWGAKGTLPAGGAQHLRQILRDAANDIADMSAAGVAIVPVHTTAKIPADFLSGGRHMHRNPAFGNVRPDEDDGNVKSVGPDGVYDWIVQALHAIATDIAALKAANGLAFTPRTVPVP